jgi:hypothetical protein
MKTVQINVEVQYLPILLDALHAGYFKAAEYGDSKKMDAVQSIEILAGIGVLYKQIVGTVKEVMPDFYNYIMNDNLELKEFNELIDMSLNLDGIKMALANLKIMGEHENSPTKFDKN